MSILFDIKTLTIIALLAIGIALTVQMDQFNRENIKLTHCITQDSLIIASLVYDRDSLNKEIAIYDDVVFGVLTYNIEYLPCKELIRGNLNMLRTMKRDNVLPLWKDIGRDIYADSIYLSRN